MKVIECIEKRHSTRAFSQRVVERDKLEQIVRCGVLAPTGSSFCRASEKGRYGCFFEILQTCAEDGYITLLWS